MTNVTTRYNAKASQCGYVVCTSASRQGDPGSNPIAAWKSCEVYPGLGILQPQWNPYPNLPRLPAECVTSIQSVALSMVWQSVTTHCEVAGDLSSRTQLESDVNTVGLSFQ